MKAIDSKSPGTDGGILEEVSRTTGGDIGNVILGMFSPGWKNG